MSKPTIPYRITIELAVGAKGKTIQVSGEIGAVGDGEAFTSIELTAMAANALAWQSHAMAEAAANPERWQQNIDLMNMPVYGKPN